MNFLDVTLNLTTGLHKIYHKPNTTPQYVNIRSNHPPGVLNNIPLGINKRLSNISSNTTTFNEEIGIYQDALDRSGYSHKLAFQAEKRNNRNDKNKKRRRNILWYNPPFSKNVLTNIGKAFLRIIDKEFQRPHKLYKIFNRNCIKISYSCMSNVSHIISAHNQRLLQDQHTSPPRECNCRNVNNCPLQGKCLTKSIVYKATVNTTDGQPDQHYIGLTDTTFKERYYNHTASFRHCTKRQNTELSKHIWRLKDNNINYSIKWTILKRATSYNNITGRCNLCLYEKLYIIYNPRTVTLNKRSELISTCRHSSKFLLSNFKT